MPRVALLFAPFAAPYMPPLGLPLLSAFLQDNGIDSCIHDLNIEFYDRLLRPEEVSRALDRLTRTYRSLRARRQLAPPEAEAFFASLPLVLSKEVVERDFEDSLGLYRRQREIESRKDLFHASQVLSFALRAMTSDLGWLNPHPRNPFLRIEPHRYEEILGWVEWRPHVEWYRDRLQAIATDWPIVGMSVCYPTQLPMTLLAAHLLRQDAPHIRIVLGGPFVTSMLKRVTHNVPKGFLGGHCRLFDAAVLGDGEYPLLAYARRGDGSAEEYSTIIPSSRLGEPLAPAGTTSAPSPPPPPPSLLPAFDKVPLHLYLAPRLTLPMLTSRHCYWGKCTFCAHSIGYNSYHQYPPEALAVQLLEAETRFGAGSIYFMDECLPPKSASRIAAALRQADSGLRWAADVRFEAYFTRERLCELYEGGCRYLAFGLESVNPRVNRLMKKNTTREVIARIIDDCDTVGIHVCVMFFCGFPTETKAEAHETVDFVFDRIDRLSAIGMSHFTLCPGTELFENASKYGIHDVQEDGGFEIDRGMSRKQSLAFRHWAGRKFGKEVYEGHELYHRLFYTLDVAQKRNGRSNAPDPYPLGVASRGAVTEAWRQVQSAGEGRYRLQPGLTIDSMPFKAERSGEGAVLKRLEDGHGAVVFNFDHPLGPISVLKPALWPALADSSLLQTEMTKALRAVQLIDQGVVCRDARSR